MFACKDENVKFSCLQVNNLSDTTRPQENKNETFPVSEGFSHEEKLDIQIWFDYSYACAVQSFTS